QPVYTGQSREHTPDHQITDTTDLYVLDSETLEQGDTVKRMRED
ncbi:MAG: hypothetical protein J07HX5_00918, partial [halophilic archaeon J07HX5]